MYKRQPEDGAPEDGAPEDGAPEDGTPEVGAEEVGAEVDGNGDLVNAVDKAVAVKSSVMVWAAAMAAKAETAVKTVNFIFFVSECSWFCGDKRCAFGKPLNQVAAFISDGFFFSLPSDCFLQTYPFKTFSETRAQTPPRNTYCLPFLLFSLGLPFQNWVWLCPQTTRARPRKEEHSLVC